MHHMCSAIVNILIWRWGGKYTKVLALRMMEKVTV
jgi:hypothetical protein